MKISLITTLLAFTLVGCVQTLPIQPVSQQASTQATSTSLDYWINKTLSPYLIEKLSYHPRFKDRTIVLASLKGDIIQPETDGLNQHIQTQIKDKLLTAQHVKLAWQPTQQGNPGLRRLADLDCENLDRQPIVIGIESGLSSLTQQTTIRVRALDTEENIWIPGLAIKWAGVLPPKYVSLTKKTYQSPHLKGLRHHPFHANEADLVANYLAKNMSCLFRSRLFGGDLTLNTQLQSNLDDPMLTQVSTMIDRYLAKFDEVTVVKNKTNANFTLEYKISEVSGNKGLNLLSIALLKENDTLLKGMETSVYLTMPKAAPVIVAKKQPTIRTPIKQAPIKPRYNTGKNPFWQPNNDQQYSLANKEFRGRDIEQVEKEAFEYAMDYGPNNPKIAWHASANHYRGTVKGYFKVLRNVMRNGHECRKYYEEIASVGSTVGLACRDMDGTWQAID